MWKLNFKREKEIPQDTGLRAEGLQVQRWAYVYWMQGLKGGSHGWSRERGGRRQEVRLQGQAGTACPWRTAAGRRFVEWSEVSCNKKLGEPNGAVKDCRLYHVSSGIPGKDCMGQNQGDGSEAVSLMTNKGGSRGAGVRRTDSCSVANMAFPLLPTTST